MMAEISRFLLVVSCLAAYQPGLSEVSASPIPTHFGDWLKTSFIGPGRGNGSLKDEIECYSLPFGGLGFVSNVLTYYTIIMFGFGLSPWKPFASPFLCCIRPCGIGRGPFIQWVKLHGGWDEFILGAASFLISVPLALYTIYRCRIGWEFVLMAVWKTTLSATLTFMGLHCWYIIRNNKKNGRDITRGSRRSEMDYIRGSRGSEVDIIRNYQGSGRDRRNNRRSRRNVRRSYNGGRKRKVRVTLLWTVLYALGTLIGSVGLMSLVAKTFSRSRNIKVITGVFVGVLGIGVVLGTVLAVVVTVGEPRVQFALGTSIATLILGFEILVAFYSDFVLAAIAENWSGAPSSDTTLLFWVYFAAKRLPLLFS